MDEQDSFAAALKKAREIAAKMQATMKPAASDDPSATKSGSELTPVIDNKKKLALQIATNLSRRIPKEIRVVTEGTNRDGEMVIHMMIPSIVVCLFAGKDNETVEWMRKSTGCRMVMDFDHPYANPNEKPLTISGHPDRVQDARIVVENYIREKDELLGTTTNNMQLSLGIEYSEIQIPKETIGLVIGKQGENIKNISMETGCAIKFRPLGPRDDDRFRIATFQGTTGQIKKAREQMIELVEFIKQKYGLARPIPKAGQELEEVRVTASKAGIVIGKGGENIKQINNLSGAMVCIDRSIPEHAQFRNFFVVGTRQQIDHAKFLIREKSGESGDLGIEALMSLNPLLGGPDSFADQPPMPASFIAMAASMMTPSYHTPAYEGYQQWYPPQSGGNANYAQYQQQAQTHETGQDYTAYWNAYYHQCYAQGQEGSGVDGNQQMIADEAQTDPEAYKAYWHAYYQQYYAQNSEQYQQYMAMYGQGEQGQTQQGTIEVERQKESPINDVTDDVSDTENMQIDEGETTEEIKPVEVTSIIEISPKKLVSNGGVPEYTAHGSSSETSSDHELQENQRKIISSKRVGKKQSVKKTKR